MNPELLLAHFNRISAAPDAIPRLRRFVLDLAIRGKLVEQDPKDEPAFELLKRIQAEKGKLTKDGFLRKEKSLPPVAEDEASYAIPTNWIWARIGNVSLLTDYGTSVKSDHAESGVPVLKMGDIQGGQAILGGQKKVPRQIEDLPQLFLKRFDLLYNRTNSAELVGKTGIYLGDDDTYTFASYLIRIRFLNDLTSPVYANLAMNAPYFRATQIIPELQQQCGQANVNGTKLRNMLIPVPPLAEQYRIVAKVDELMALCDRLEAAQRERDSRRDRLTAASHHHLNNDAEADALREHAHFFVEQLPRLSARPDQIKQLRQTIFNLAIRGKLVPQDPHDEPASALLKRIQDEKLLMVRDGKIRRHAPLHPIRREEAPFNIPPSWEWARLGTVCHLITDGAHHTPAYEDNGVPFLSVKDVSAGTIDFSNTRFISTAAHRELCKRCMPEFGDILLTKVGTTGIAVTVDVKREFSIFVSLALLKFSKSHLNRFYIRNLINSPFVKQQSADNTQGIGNKNLVLRLINQFIVPIPPLAEQHRIVARVDELMALCDQLEAQLTSAQIDTSRLLEAVLHSALNDSNPSAAASHASRLIPTHAIL